MISQMIAFSFRQRRPPPTMVYRSSHFFFIEFSRIAPTDRRRASHSRHFHSHISRLSASRLQVMMFSIALQISHYYFKIR